MPAPLHLPERRRSSSPRAARRLRLHFPKPSGPLDNHSTVGPHPLWTGPDWLSILLLPLEAVAVAETLLRRRQPVALAIFGLGLYFLIMLFRATAHFHPDEDAPEFLTISPTTKPVPHRPPDWWIANRVLQAGALTCLVILLILYWPAPLASLLGSLR